MRKQSDIEPIEAETAVCCQTIPISHLQLEFDKPFSGWEAMLDAHGVEVVVDDVGRPAINRQALSELIAERTQRQDRLARESQERISQAEKPRVLVGAPALEGRSAYESMVAAAGLLTPDEEFSGREKPNFLEEQLAASARAIAEKRAQTAGGTRNEPPTS